MADPSDIPVVPLDDDRWDDVETAYGTSCDELRGWLAEAYAGALSDALLGDVVNEVAHQGDHSEAIYAVVPHLVRLSRVLTNAQSLLCLMHAGLLCANADRHPCPAALEDEYAAAREFGLSDLRERLSPELDESTFRYALAAAAGFAGHRRVADALDRFDFVAAGECCPACGRFA